MKLPTTKTTGINVLSLFCGISGSRLALESVGIPVANFYSSEVDKSALAVQNYHFSADTTFHQIGDVKNVRALELPEIDFCIFGSPCTNLSNVGDRTGFNGENESSLFAEAVRILSELKKIADRKNKPFYFLMENVQMKKEFEYHITSELEKVFPGEVNMIKLNSSLLCCANRRRTYWSNYKNVEPEPVNASFQDALVNGYVDRGREKANVLLGNNCTLTGGIRRFYSMNIGNIVFKDKEFADLEPETKLRLYPDILLKSGYKGKAGSSPDEYSYENGCYRTISILESERCQGIKEGFLSNLPTRVISKTNCIRAIGLGFSIPIITHLVTPLNELLLSK
ncbi:MAG: DNA cytosine methyltransferase [Bacteroidota bacterium]